jgi:hypothetical protein
LATSPVPLWAQEMSPHHRGPTGADVLTVAVVTILVALLLLPRLATARDASFRSGRALSPACAELQRLERHGVRSGASWRRVDRACREANHGR